MAVPGYLLAMEPMEELGPGPGNRNRGLCGLLHIWAFLHERGAPRRRARREAPL